MVMINTHIQIGDGKIEIDFQGDRDFEIVEVFQMNNKITVEYYNHNWNAIITGDDATLFKLLIELHK